MEPEHPGLDKLYESTIKKNPKNKQKRFFT